MKREERGFRSLWTLLSDSSLRAYNAPAEVSKRDLFVACVERRRSERKGTGKEFSTMVSTLLLSPSSRLGYGGARLCGGGFSLVGSAEVQLKLICR